MRPSASAVLRLVRWPNALIAAAGVLAGAWWAGGRPLDRAPLLAALSAVFLTAVANAANDLADVEIDRVAHPRRPLPSGALTRRHARLVTVVAAVLGPATAALAHPPLGVAGVAVVLLMLVYSWRLKRLGLPGNLLVALLASLPFVWGAWSVGRPLAALDLLALAVPLHLAREIAKDLDDAGADAPVRRTLPVRHGAHRARIVLLLALLAFGGALTAFAWQRPRFAIAAIPIMLLCGMGARRALRGERGGPALFKSAMVCAILSLVTAAR